VEDARDAVAEVGSAQREVSLKRDRICVLCSTISTRRIGDAGRREVEIALSGGYSGAAAEIGKSGLARSSVPFLRESSDRDGWWPVLDSALSGSDLARKQPEQGRLAYAVRPDHGHPRRWANGEVDPMKDGPICDSNGRTPEDDR